GDLRSQLSGTRSPPDGTGDCGARRHHYAHRAGLARRGGAEWLACPEPELRDACMTTRDTEAALDPITVEVVRHKLDGIANEMRAALLRSPFSPIVKEGLAPSASLFTPDGTTLAQSCSIPIHLATLIPAVAEVLRIFPIDTMAEGDAYVLNDPYTGGTHLPDI